MKLLRLKTTDPYYNLAVEEYLFENSDEDIFMLWQNEPTVVIGKNQNPYAELKIDLASKMGIKIARRITGGGAVYHDLGNLNYSYIGSKKVQKEIDFGSFCAPILSVLASLGVDARLSGRNDITVGEKKISGNAQHSSGDRVLHHGTLLYDSDLSVLSSVLVSDPEKLKAKAVRSVSSRVMNLKEVLPLDGGVSALSSIIAEAIERDLGAESIEAPSNERIDALAARNASSDWLFPKRRFLTDYTVNIKKRYDFGTVRAEIRMSADTVCGICISGDFFGNEDISDIETLLLGAKLGEIPLRLKDIGVGRYIFGMTDGELIELIHGGITRQDT